MLITPKLRRSFEYTAPKVLKTQNSSNSKLKK